MKRSWLLAIAVVLGLGSMTPALAAPLTIDATGVASIITEDDGFLPLFFPGGVANGTPVSVSLTYDVALFGTPTITSTNSAIYAPLDGGLSGTFTVGSAIYTLDRGAFAIRPFALYEFSFLGADGTTATGGRVLPSFSLSFLEAGGVPPNFDPPVDPIDFAAFDRVVVGFLARGAQGTSGQADSFGADVVRTTPVPEPSSLALLAAAFAGLALARRGRPMRRAESSKGRINRPARP